MEPRGGSDASTLSLGDILQRLAHEAPADLAMIERIVRQVWKHHLGQGAAPVMLEVNASADRPSRPADARSILMTPEERDQFLRGMRALRDAEQQFFMAAIMVIADRGWDRLFDLCSRFVAFQLETEDAESPRHAIFAMLDFFAPENGSAS